MGQEPNSPLLRLRATLAEYFVVGVPELHAAADQRSHCWRQLERTRAGQPPAARRAADGHPREALQGVRASTQGSERLVLHRLPDATLEADGEVRRPAVLLLEEPRRVGSTVGRAALRLDVSHGLVG